MGYAIGVLVASVYLLARLDLVSLAKGLGATLILIGAVGGFLKTIGDDKGSVAAAATILLVAMAVRILADAVVVFASMSWEELARGFLGLAGGLVAVGLAMHFMPDGVKMIFAALGIGKVAAATMLIAKAMKEYSGIEWDAVAKGLVSLGGSMYILVKAMNNMPKVGLPQTVGLLIVAFAIGLVADAVKMLGQLDISTALQGVITVAVIMEILVASMNAMEGTARGAAALLIVAVALNVLIPVIQTLGSMPIAALVTALVALAAVFVILGVAAYFLAPGVPVLMSLGIAIALIGAAMALAGVGVFLFATGLTALGVAGAAATAGIVAIVSGLIGLIPMVIYQIGLGLVAFAKVIATAGPAIQEAMATVMIAFLQAIIDVTPKVVEALLVLVFNFLHTLDQAVPRIIQTGINLLIALLDGIARNIGRVVDTVVKIITNFLDAISRNLPKIIQSGIDLIISFVEGLAKGIRDNSERMGEAGADLAMAIVEGMVKGIGAGARKVINKVKGLAGDALDAAKNFLGINSPSREFAKIGMGIDEGMAQGIGDYAVLVTDATERMGSDTLGAMGKTINGLGALIEDGMGSDLNPVVTPVLDLTSIQKDASGIGALLGGTPLDVGASYSAAARASDGYRSNQAALSEQLAEAAGTNVSFTQNNHSPKALSSIDIYRNTNNQLSVARGALKRTGVSTR